MAHVSCCSLCRYRDEAYADAVTKKTGTGRPDADAAEAEEAPEWADDDDALDGDTAPFLLGVTPLQRDADKAFLHQHGYLPDNPVVPQVQPPIAEKKAANNANVVQNPDAIASEQGPGGGVADGAQAQHQRDGQGAAASHPTALDMLRKQQPGGGPAPLDVSKAGEFVCCGGAFFLSMVVYVYWSLVLGVKNGGCVMVAEKAHYLFLLTWCKNE